MPKYSIISLYSGSRGNSTLICSENTKILIDAGRSARALTSALAALGVKAEEIDAIFITHEHTDHISALPVLLKKRDIPVHAVSASTERALLRDERFFGNMLHNHEPIYSVTVGNMTITSFPTPHDSNFSVGYRIEIGDGDDRVCVGYATDTGEVTAEMMSGLYGCESVVIESNHDLDMLRRGPYPYELKERIMSRRGHLSNSECASFANYLCSGGTKNILLAHLSEENNEPSLAYDEVLSAICDYDVRLTVASPCESVRLI